MSTSSEHNRRSHKSGGEHSHRHRHSKKHRSGSQADVTPASFGLRMVDFCLMSAIFAVPMFFGGKHLYGETLLFLSACGAGIGWVAHLLTLSETRWQRSRVELLFLAIASLCIVQTIPLSVATLDSLSPETRKLLPFWFNTETSAFVGGSWRFLSLTPGITQSAYCVIFSYMILFLVAVQRMRSVDDAERLLRWIGLAGALMSALALTQFVFSNDRFLWVIEHPEGTTSDRPKGLFLNKNHFAQFAALSVGPLVYLLLWHLHQTRSVDDSGQFQSQGTRTLPPHAKTGLLSAGLAFVLAGLLMAQSRGAVLAAAIGFLFLLVVLYRRSLITTRVAGSVVCIGVLAASMLMLVEQQQLQRAVSRLDKWDDNGRLPIWKANLAAISDFPIFGTGIGSHRYIYPRYLDEPYQRNEYSYAESSLLQITTESGLTGLTLAVIALLICFYWCGRGLRIAQSNRSALILAAVTTGLLISVVHAIYDFVWHVPGCMMPIIIMMAVACRMYQLERTACGDEPMRFSRTIPKLAIPCGLLLFVLTGIWSGRELVPQVRALPHWSAYRAVALSELTGRGDIMDESPDEPADQRAAARFRRRLLELRAANRRYPLDSRVHMRLAVHYTQLFALMQKNSSNAMPLNQLRDAAVSSEFESPQALREWLERATDGSIRYALAALHHAKRAVQLNPLEAHAWLHLTELAFLEGGPPETSDRILEQTLVLRPYDAQVLFVAGRDAYLHGDLERWLAFWKNAFHRDVGIQQQIITQLTSFTETPVDLLMEHFQPDVSAMERMVEAVMTTELEEQKAKGLALLADALVRRAGEKENRERAQDWLKAATAFDELHQDEQTRICFDKALAASPSNFSVHLEFGGWLLKRGERSAALEQLHWCERVQPDHVKLQRLMEQLVSNPGKSSPIRKVAGEQSRQPL